jgi:hypothetical protein
MSWALFLSLRALGIRVSAVEFCLDNFVVIVWSVLAVRSPAESPTKEENTQENNR